MWYKTTSYGMWEHGWGLSVALIAAWSLVWSGLALWHAARRGEKWWFVIFLLVHTAGILELIYLAFVVKAFQSSAPVKSSARRRKS